MKFPLLVSAALLLVSSVAHAEDPLSRTINNACRYIFTNTIPPPGSEGKIQPGVMFKGMCMGSIRTLLYIEDWLNEESKFCRPKGVKLNEAIKVLVNYMDENPISADEELSVVAIVAFQDAWPCKK